jgi:hypothetical protein
MVLDRLSAWYDGARMAEKQSLGPDVSIYRNEMMNYAHLMDLLNEGLKGKK